MRNRSQLISDLRRVSVRAEREVVYESPDHLNPQGTRRDNSRNWRFNQKLTHLFDGQKGPIWVLDWAAQAAAL